MARESKGLVTTGGEGDAGEVGSVVLRGLTVALDTDVGQAFITDCARNTEGLLPDDEIREKYGLSARAWERLASNTPAIHAVRAERARRVANGAAAREGAQRHFVKVPDVLGKLLTDELVSPRHRIDAAKELREVAANGPDATSTGDKFVIRINFGGEEKRYEFNKAPLVPLEDGPPLLLSDGEKEDG
jgi:hypothetical protein